MIIESVLELEQTLQKTPLCILRTLWAISFCHELEHVGGRMAGVEERLTIAPMPDLLVSNGHSFLHIFEMCHVSDGLKRRIERTAHQCRSLAPEVLAAKPAEMYPTFHHIRKRA